MQLSQIGKPNPIEFEFKDPYTGQSFTKPIFVSVHAIKSKVGKEATQKMQHNILKLRQDENNLIDGEIKLEVASQETIKWIADLVETWRGVEDEKGKEIPPSKEAFIEAFTQSEEFLNAVYAFAANLGNYLAK